MADRAHPPCIETFESLNNYMPTCSQCDRSVSPVVVVGEVDDYDSATARLCIDCVTTAAKLLGEHLAKKG